MMIMANESLEDKSRTEKCCRVMAYKGHRNKKETKVVGNVSGKRERKE